MTASDPGVAVALIDIILVTSGLILVLLVALVETPGSADGGGPGSRLLEPPDAGQQRSRPRQGTGLPPAEPAGLWWVQPGPLAVDNVPAEVQAEALEILETLRDLDVFFTDRPHRTPPGMY